MTNHTLVTAKQLPPALMEQLARFGQVRVYDPDQAESSLQGANVWVGTSMDPVPAALIETFPETLGLITNLGVGTDNVDLAAAAAAGIEISNTPVVTEDTADLAMALLLATCRRLGETERALREGDWAGGAGLLGTRVHGRTLGIVGFGAIGQAVARRARGFDMDVLYHGPRRKPGAETESGARFRESLYALLAESDFVSLHCPLTEATRHIIDAQALGNMKAGGILINTGRGPLVDEAALVEALAGGCLAGAGLDVFEFEPEVTPALKTMDNVTLLPHIGSATTQCRFEMAARALANIRSFLETGHPIDRVRE